MYFNRINLVLQQKSSWMEIMDHYYFANRIWIILNIVCTIPFLIAGICRFFKTQMQFSLKTDHLSRLFLTIQCLFYIYDTVIKYIVDGDQTICQKAIFIHHFTTPFVIVPIILNDYIPWWVNPIGFLHGFLVFYPHLQQLNYVYGFAVLHYHYQIYKKPYRDIPYYWLSRYAINGVWTFAIMLMVGDCSNYLPVGPD